MFISVVPVLAALAYLAFVGEPSHAQSASAVDARSTYLADCAVCHQADGGGSPRGPSLRGVGRASIDYMVTTGRMPLAEPTDRLERRTPRYSPDQQRALVDYVTGLSQGGPDIPNLDLSTADVAAGGEAFREQCAACHAWSGTGGALLEREAPGLGAATPTQIAEAIRTGPGTMPVFGAAALDDQQLNNTTAFVDSLKRTDDRGGLPLAHIGPVTEGAIAIIVGLGLLLVAVRWIGTDR
ncbi:MAG TPA: c-type cytochrome [Jatrophihabitantaceae bacterium]|nr:c-type cytochrome [Jatrophihabitantaceae bacterium]